MTSTTRTKRDILKSLAPYLPMTLLAFAVYALVAGAGTLWLLHGRVRTPLLGAALIIVLLIVAGLGLLYVRFIINRIARFHLSIDGGTLTVRAQTTRGLVERQYQLSDI